MKLTVQPQQTPKGSYTARIIRLDEQIIGSQIVIRILTRIESTEHSEANGARVSTLVDPELRKNSRVGRWVKAALGRELKDGDVIDLDELLQKVVRITVDNRTNKKNEVYTRIVAVHPVE